MKRTDSEWKRILSQEEYRILREKVPNAPLQENMMGILKKECMFVPGVEMIYLNLIQNIDPAVVGLLFMMPFRNL